MTLPRLNVHFFSSTEKPRRGVWWHRRAFLTVRRHEEDSNVLFGARLEAILRKPTPELSLRFHVGNEASETPWDGHVLLAGSGIFWGLENGQKLAARLTRCAKHRWEGRDLSLRMHDGRVYVHVWTHPGTWERGEFAKWRERSWRTNPLDVLYGPKRYRYIDMGVAELDIDLPEGAYPVTATLQQQLYGRPRGKRQVESWVVDVNARQGVPNRVDQSGWKGDRVYGFAVPLAQALEDWSVDAKAAIAAQILNDRARSGFRRPDAQDHQ